ncbi:ADP-ribosyltransferase [Actinoallomurus sp. CA-150999]|uniref:ADP-ribosyltransferase n=1 Tax=Actinoallomurus sp. CA-150999 TaxID=3239887 RepID=UPI003D8F85A5
MNSLLFGIASVLLVAAALTSRRTGRRVAPSAGVRPDPATRPDSVVAGVGEGPRRLKAKPWHLVRGRAVASAALVFGLLGGLIPQADVTLRPTSVPGTGVTLAASSDDLPGLTDPTLRAVYDNELTGEPSRRQFAFAWERAEHDVGRMTRYLADLRKRPGRTLDQVLTELYAQRIKREAPKTATAADADAALLAAVRPVLARINIKEPVLQKFLTRAQPPNAAKRRAETDEVLRAIADLPLDAAGGIARIDRDSASSLVADTLQSVDHLSELREVSAIARNEAKSGTTVYAGLKRTEKSPAVVIDGTVVPGLEIWAEAGQRGAEIDALYMGADGLLHIDELKAAATTSNTRAIKQLPRLERWQAADPIHRRATMRIESTGKWGRLTQEDRVEGEPAKMFVARVADAGVWLRVGGTVFEPGQVAALADAFETGTLVPDATLPSPSRVRADMVRDAGGSWIYRGLLSGSGGTPAGDQGKGSVPAVASPAVPSTATVPDGKSPSDRLQNLLNRLRRQSSSRTASRVPDGTLPAIFDGSADPDELARLYERDYAALAKINTPRYRPSSGYDQNCLYCAIGTDEAVATGTRDPAPAPPVFDATDRERAYELQREIVSRQGVHPVSSWDEIVAEMQRAGEGARALVALWRKDGSAHILNVVHDANGVVFLDSQKVDGGRGGFAALPRIDSLKKIELIPTDFLSQSSGASAERPETLATGAGEQGSSPNATPPIDTDLARRIGQFDTLRTKLGEADQATAAAERALRTAQFSAQGAPAPPETISTLADRLHKALDAQIKTENELIRLGNKITSAGGKKAKAGWLRQAQIREVERVSAQWRAIQRDQWARGSTWRARVEKLGMEWALPYMARTKRIPHGHRHLADAAASGELDRQYDTSLVNPGEGSTKALPAPGSAGKVARTVKGAGKAVTAPIIAWSRRVTGSAGVQIVRDPVDGGFYLLLRNRRDKVEVEEIPNAARIKTKIGESPFWQVGEIRGVQVGFVLEGVANTQSSFGLKWEKQLGQEKWSAYKLSPFKRGPWVISGGSDNAQSGKLTRQRKVSTKVDVPLKLAFRLPGQQEAWSVPSVIEAKLSFEVAEDFPLDFSAPNAMARLFELKPSLELVAGVDYNPNTLAEGLSQWLEAHGIKSPPLDAIVDVLKEALSGVNLSFESAFVVPLGKGFKGVNAPIYSPDVPSGQVASPQSGADQDTATPTTRVRASGQNARNRGFLPTEPATSAVSSPRGAKPAVTPIGGLSVAPQFGETTWDAVLARLSGGQKKTLRDYSEGHFAELNDFLRGKRNSSPWGRIALKRKAAALDRIMRRRPVPQDIDVIRSVTAGAFGAPLNALAGTVVDEPGFMSTSLGGKVFSPSRPVRLHLRVPRGTPAVYLGTLSRNDENELLLARNLKYFVVGVRQGPDEQGEQKWDVFAVVLPQDNADAAADALKKLMRDDPDAIAALMGETSQPVRAKTGTGGSVRAKVETGRAFPRTVTDVADDIARANRDVTVRRRYGSSRAAELVIDGDRYGIYRPASAAPDKIASGLRAKYAELAAEPSRDGAPLGGIVVDLSKSGASAQSVGNALSKTAGQKGIPSAIIVVGGDGVAFLGDARADAKQVAMIRQFFAQVYGQGWDRTGYVQNIMRQIEQELASALPSDSTTVRQARNKKIAGLLQQIAQALENARDNGGQYATDASDPSLQGDAAEAARQQALDRLTELYVRMNTDPGSVSIDEISSLIGRLTPERITPGRPLLYPDLQKAGSLIHRIQQERAKGDQADQSLIDDLEQQLRTTLHTIVTTPQVDGGTAIRTPVPNTGATGGRTIGTGKTNEVAQPISTGTPPLPPEVVPYRTQPQQTPVEVTLPDGRRVTLPITPSSPGSAVPEYVPAPGSRIALPQTTVTAPTTRITSTTPTTEIPQWNGSEVAIPGTSARSSLPASSIGGENYVQFTRLPATGGQTGESYVRFTSLSPSYGAQNPEYGGTGLIGRGGGDSPLSTTEEEEAAQPVCNCFPAGTPVATTRGSVPIQDIRVGDHVWAHSLTTGRTELRRVTALFNRHATRMLTLTVSGGVTVQVTPDHPFWIPGRGWTTAGDLRPGDHLARRDGGTAVLLRATERRVSTTVYNFSVAGDHDYYVSAAQLLVHNCTLPGGGRTNGGTRSVSSTDRGETGGYTLEKALKNYNRVFGDASEDTSTGSSGAAPDERPTEKIGQGGQHNAYESGETSNTVPPEEPIIVNGVVEQPPVVRSSDVEAPRQPIVVDADLPKTTTSTPDETGLNETETGVSGGLAGVAGLGTDELANGITRYQESRYPTRDTVMNRVQAYLKMLEFARNDARVAGAPDNGDPAELIASYSGTKPGVVDKNIQTIQSGISQGLTSSPDPGEAQLMYDRLINEPAALQVAGRDCRGDSACEKQKEADWQTLYDLSLPQEISDEQAAYGSDPTEIAQPRYENGKITAVINKRTGKPDPYLQLIYEWQRQGRRSQLAGLYNIQADNATVSALGYQGLINGYTWDPKISNVQNVTNLENYITTQLNKNTNAVNSASAADLSPSMLPFTGGSITYKDGFFNAKDPNDQAAIAQAASLNMELDQIKSQATDLAVLNDQINQSQQQAQGQTFETAKEKAVKSLKDAGYNVWIDGNGKIWYSGNGSAGSADTVGAKINSTVTQYFNSANDTYQTDRFNALIWARNNIRPYVGESPEAYAKRLDEAAAKIAAEQQKGIAAGQAQSDVTTNMPPDPNQKNHYLGDPANTDGTDSTAYVDQTVDAQRNIQDKACQKNPSCAQSMATEKQRVANDQRQVANNRLKDAVQQQLSGGGETTITTSNQPTSPNLVSKLGHGNSGCHGNHCVTANGDGYMSNNGASIDTNNDNGVSGTGTRPTTQPVPHSGTPSELSAAESTANQKDNKQDNNGHDELGSSVNSSNENSTLIGGQYGGGEHQSTTRNDNNGNGNLIAGQYGGGERPSTAGDNNSNSNSNDTATANQKDDKHQNNGHDELDSSVNSSSGNQDTKGSSDPTGDGSSNKDDQGKHGGYAAHLDIKSYKKNHKEKSQSNSNNSDNSGGSENDNRNGHGSGGGGKDNNAGGNDSGGNGKDNNGGGNDNGKSSNGGGDTSNESNPNAGTNGGTQGGDRPLKAGGPN